MSSVIKKNKNVTNLVLSKEILSDKFCNGVITKYFHKIIRKGDYYSLDVARYLVETHNFKKNKEDRLIDVLELVSDCRGIDKAKAKLQGKELDDFKRSLKDLDEIFVNPVTIPRSWGIKYIPNLLRAYNDIGIEEQAFSLRELITKKSFKAHC